MPASIEEAIRERDMALEDVAGLAMQLEFARNEFEAALQAKEKELEKARAKKMARNDSSHKQVCFRVRLCAHLQILHSL